LGSTKRHLAPTTRPSTGGRIYVWEYPETVESFAGWHLTADSVGAGRLLAAIDDLLSRHYGFGGYSPLASTGPRASVEH
jgi:hypothetical protein